MSRELSAEHLAAIDEDTPIPIYFVALEFGSGTVYAHSRIGTISWGGVDWIGVGSFGEIGAVEETSELAVKTVTYTLAGIPREYISITQDEHYQGRPARLYLGFIDRTTRLLVDTPFILDTGRMNVSEIDEGATCTVTITAQSRMSFWDKPAVRRYTDADQQKRFPGDKGFAFVSQAAQKEILWGRK
jgi:hypothetical protein